MFDKNSFKVQFRLWAVEHLEANSRDAQLIAQELIPYHEMREHDWLIQETVQWFQWMKWHMKDSLQEKNSF